VQVNKKKNLTQPPTKQPSWTARNYAIACIESDIRICNSEIDSLHFQIERKRELQNVLSLRLKNLTALP
jgi:hypothetical protein